MKPIVRRMWGKLILLAVCVFLSGCCTFCKKCPEDAECVIITSSAATGIRSSAGGADPNTDTYKPGPQTVPLPAEWRASYPLFEGDYFSVVLPEASDRSDTPEPPAISTQPPAYPGGADGPSGSDDWPVFDAPPPSDVVSPMDHPGGVIELPDGLGGTILVPNPSPTEAQVRAFARQKVKTVVSHMGFGDPTGGDVLTKEFFEIGPHLMKSGGGDILKAAQINCEMGTQIDSSFCDLEPDQQKQLIALATGIDAEKYLDRRMNRYYFYQRPQYREWPPDPGLNEGEYATEPISTDDNINVFIEHSFITATTRPDGTVRSINGRIFPSYKITNQPELTLEKALDKAYKHLWGIPGVSRYAAQPSAERNPTLVLLPYGYARRLDLGNILSLEWLTNKTPQLRYAYRTTLWGNFIDETGRRVEAASWRTWVDAETGHILQLLPQFAFAETGGECTETGFITNTGAICATGKGWRIAPPDEPVEAYFRINNRRNSAGQYCLGLDGVFEPLEYRVNTASQAYVPPVTFCSDNLNFANGLTCPSSNPGYCICSQNAIEPFAYLQMNAYSHADRYQRLLDATLCEPQDSTNLAACQNGHFRVAKDTNSGSYVPMRIGINNQGSMGRYVVPRPKFHLALGGIGAAFSSSDCSTSYATSTGNNRPGAQDATIIIHEFSHLVTDGLLSSRPDDWCNEPGADPVLVCPVPHSLDLVHDLADGFAALHTGTNWFGAWWMNLQPGPSSNDEFNLAPRELNHESDHFPEHRNWSKLPNAPDQVKFGHKDYADGQIAGAALWAAAESLERWLPTVGRVDLQASLLNLMPSFREFPDACGAFKQQSECDYPDNCDLDIYRLLHFLLRGLHESQPATGILALNAGPTNTVAANKILAGFAKTGVFLVPPQCIGANTSDPTSTEDSYCSAVNEYGGDAVIEIKDDWLNHCATELPPSLGFDIWTGPTFRFVAEDNETPPYDAVVSEHGQEPCNKYFKISLANNHEFKPDDSNNWFMKEMEEYREVGDGCRYKWTPDTTWSSFWNKVARASRTHGLSKLYYRVITSPTKDTTPETVLSSSEYPGNPKKAPNIYDRVSQHRVDPPFAILNDIGEPSVNSVSSSCN